MEAPALYERFETNVDTILSLINSGLDIRTTPFPTSVPLEVGLLCEVLNWAGAAFAISREGIGALEEFRQEYMQHKATASEAMHRVLEDKRSFMRAPGGATVLLKEMLIRRLEYFNETARSLKIMKSQQELGSPKQYTYHTQLEGKKAK